MTPPRSSEVVISGVTLEEFVAKLPQDLSRSRRQLLITLFILADGCGQVHFLSHEDVIAAAGLKRSTYGACLRKLKCERYLLDDGIRTNGVGRQVRGLRINLAELGD
jgi:hypothetical protein